MATIEGTDAKGVINTPALIVSPADISELKSMVQGIAGAEALVDRLVAERDMHKRHVANLNGVFERMQERGILS